MAPESLEKLSKPVFITSHVIHGFGRGSKKLGCPTANLEYDVVQKIQLDSGIYYGFAQLLDPPSRSTTTKTKTTAAKTMENNNDNHHTNNIEDLSIYRSTSPLNPIYPTVFSLGWNPHFDDVKQRTLEAHLLHSFDDDFYNSTIRVAICGYIRPERKFNSLDELIDTIKDDIRKTKIALQRPEQEWSSIINDSFFFVDDNSSMKMKKLSIINNHNHHHDENNVHIHNNNN
ncbi:riboflavin kinase [Dermatophagoides pteronyssinus]|uniref:riboflavin kinase n=1 Tax=Dermatophagoides pteronyssinus TaxID=6956 RepID=A0A6P6YID3_DERPT|nr:riboflavin kinase-like [Dermatophagoides pteronyssinus]